MKFFMKFILGLFLLIGLGVTSIFYFTSGLVDLADSFFSKARKGNTSAAYALVSSEFQANTTEGQLTDFLKSFGLDRVKASSWTNRKIENGAGTLEGTVTTDTGQAIQLTMNFIKEGGVWKILGMHKASAGLGTAETGTVEPQNGFSAPSEEEQIRLVQEAMRSFGVAVNERSMSSFHGFISKTWQSQYNVQRLEEAYASLYGVDGDLTQVSAMTPAFLRPATVDAQGIMQVAGFFPTTPTRVNFEQKFILEGTKWKLFGFNINFTKVGQPSGPTSQAEQASN